MGAPVYRAYISYSHRDEAWAKWLHRALESYRVPRKLVGKKTSAGEVPARLQPVFRDRADLSSATDLGDSVKQVLADSENLIVLCSPAAVASHWVGEEIRQFKRLGRSERIFCVVVDGDPAATDSAAACFPPALGEAGLHEPLAADVRKWADGKRVAKLKLIAGLLGLRLDDFLQRNLQRRRKRQLLTGMGVAAALALAVITVTAQISERHEREKAEQLATFIVDLGERLQTDADLETLALISAEATRHLQNLDQDRLAPATGKRVALALRQMGRVSQYQGKPDVALEAFLRSRDLLSSLTERYPATPDLMYELGNAEYYVGNLHYSLGRHDQARESMQHYYDVAQTLFELDPDNPDWILELSYAHNNLAAIRLGARQGVDQATLAHVDEAVRLFEIVVALKSDDPAISSDYATTLAWAADAQAEACNLDQAMELRHKALALVESSTWADPGNNELKKQHAYALTGVAYLQAQGGETASAIGNLEQAVAILQTLFAADPSNFHYREQTLYRRVMLARLLGDNDQLDAATGMMEEIEAEFAELDELLEQGGVSQEAQTEFLLAYTDALLRQGHPDAAKSRLAAAIELQQQDQGSSDVDILKNYHGVLSRYLWWQLEGVDSVPSLPSIVVGNPVLNTGFRSCLEADSSARIYVLEGQAENAAQEVEHLAGKGYADPSFIRFCEQQGLCG